MHFDVLRIRKPLAALAIFLTAPVVCAADEGELGPTPFGAGVEAGTPIVIGSPVQVTEELLQLRQTIGSAWREFGGNATPETSAAEEEAIRTALLDHVRTNPIPERSCLPQAFCRRAELRESAHQLDLVAHTLECQELYDEADQLRAVAQRLREQARQQTPVELHKGWIPAVKHAAD